MKEFCIMKDGIFKCSDGTIIPYRCERFEGSHRHEIFFGNGIRQKSIQYGTVIFLKPEHHNMSNKGVHFNKEFDLHLKRLAQQTAMKYYEWSVETFRQVFGKNYL